MRNLLLGLFILFSSSLIAQDQEVEMADGFYAEGKIYVVIVVAALVFICIALYLYFIDRKVSKLEKKVDQKLDQE